MLRIVWIYTSADVRSAQLFKEVVRLHRLPFLQRQPKNAEVESHPAVRKMLMAAVDILGLSVWFFEEMRICR